MTDEKVLEILKVISHPTWVEILRRIKAKQCESGATCSLVWDGMDISQSTFSHHISELAQSGLIKGTSQGRFMMLEVDEEVWNEFQKNLGSAIFS